MIQKILNSKYFVACLLAAATGMTIYFRVPFPDENVFLQVMALRSPSIFYFVKYSYTLFLFSTPYIGYSIALSGVYIFSLKAGRQIRAGRLPLFPDPRKRDELFLVLGEDHNPRKPAPAENPQWLVIPERGLFTGIAILGAIGTGKTSCCRYPYADQILGWRAGDKDKRIGGLVLGVKGDFCHRSREILEHHGRGEDYIEISLNSEYHYSPLNNDLDACALAYNIASLLNNLFGLGKEPFWQQTSTNLVKFIILLHKVAFDSVTLFDVYECTIDPATLQKKINIKVGTIERSLANQLENFVLARNNILITGGTGTGKTTLVNIPGKFIPPRRKNSSNRRHVRNSDGPGQLVRFAARQPQNGLLAASIRDLVKAALRDRPDRFILGEIRGGEAFDLLQLFSTGHSGSLLTVHATSAKQGLARFTSCVL